MSYAVWIVSPGGYVHSEAFREVAEAVHWGLIELGHDSRLTCEPRPGRTHIVLGANLLPHVGPPPPGSILYNLEQITPGSPWMSLDYLDLLRRHPVWDYSEINLRELSRLGIFGQLVPIGSVPQLTRIAPAEEDIDVLFFGSMNQRRYDVLTELSRRGANVETLFGVYGPARDAVIARSKIVLNVHYFDAKIFEIVRVSYLLANRRFVVSEVGAAPAEEQPFSGGLVFGDYHELVERCLDFLNRPTERRRIADAGQAIMSARPQRRFLSQVL